MTDRASVTLTPGDWIPRPTCLWPVFVGALLLGGSTEAVPQTDARSEATPAEVPDVPAQELGGRSPAAPAGYLLDGRSRFEMRFGLSDINVSDNQWTEALDVTGGAFSLVFLHWIHENLALEVSLGASNIGVSSRRTIAGETVRADGLCGLMAGGRFYLPVPGAVRPHIGVAVGPVMELLVHDRPWQTDVTLRTTTVGLGVEAGADFLLGGHFVIGIHAGALARDGYRAHRNVGFNLGLNFGGGRRQ